MLKNLLVNLLVKTIGSARGLAAIGAIVTAVLQEQFGLSPVAAAEIVAALIAFIGGDTFRPKVK